MKLDLHAHTHYSADARTTPAELLKIARLNSVVPALTDHNTTKGWKPFQEVAERTGWPVVLGEEIKIIEDEHTIGELLGYFMSEEVPPGPLEEVLDALKAQDALVSVAHPFDFMRKALLKNLSPERRKKLLHSVHALETFNARIVYPKSNKEAARFAQEHDMPVTAGSDSHFPEEIGKAYVEVTAADLESARKAITKGRAKAHGQVSSLTVHFKTRAAKWGFPPKKGDFDDA